MFNNDRDSIIEMYQTSLTKQQYKRALVTFELIDLDVTINDLDNLLKAWKISIKNLLGDEDAAFEVNDGNIFILLHESSQKVFDKMVREFIIYSKYGKKGVRTSALYLTNEESEFLLYSNS